MSTEVRRRRRYTERERVLLLVHQHHRCAICRGPLALGDAHVDHRFPVRAGGTDDWTNLQLTHPSCNMRKGGTVLVEGPQMVLPWA